MNVDARNRALQQLVALDNRKPSAYATAEARADWLDDLAAVYSSLAVAVPEEARHYQVQADSARKRASGIRAGS